MTAAVPLVERLTEVLASHKGYEWWPMTREFICTCEASIGRDYPDPAHRAHLARALLPVVEQAVTEARGEALREAADAALDHFGSWGGAGWSGWLRDRADAIATTEGL